MTALTRLQFLELFAAPIHPQLMALMDRDDIDGLAAYETPDGKRAAVATADPRPPEVDAKGRRLLGVFLKARARLALLWMQENPGTTPYAAAHHFEISNQAVYDVIKRALKQQRKAGERPKCPCCGQVLPPA